MECPDCQGNGYREFEHGLIRLPCKKCKSTGYVKDEQRIDNGNRPDIETTGKQNPRQHVKRRKQKARR